MQKKLTKRKEINPKSLMIDRNLLFEQEMKL